MLDARIGVVSGYDMTLRRYGACAGAAAGENDCLEHAAKRHPGKLERVYMPRYPATALAAGELHLIVGLTTPVPEGTHVTLFERDNAPIAAPKTSLPHTCTPSDQRGK